MTSSLKKFDRLIVLSFTVTVVIAAVAAFLENLVASVGVIFFLGFLVVFPLGFNRDRKARSQAVESGATGTDIGSARLIGRVGFISLGVGALLAVAATVRWLAAESYGIGSVLIFAAALLILGAGLLWWSPRVTRPAGDIDAP
jgi:uncharacterized membrane protein